MVLLCQQPKYTKPPLTSKSHNLLGPRTLVSQREPDSLATPPFQSPFFTLEAQRRHEDMGYALHQCGSGPHFLQFWGEALNKAGQLDFYADWI